MRMVPIQRAVGQVMGHSKTGLSRADLDDGGTSCSYSAQQRREGAKPGKVLISAGISTTEHTQGLMIYYISYTLRAVRGGAAYQCNTFWLSLDLRP
jgi:hypothetical protein